METELRLGLPGGGGGGGGEGDHQKVVVVVRKRGFCETEGDEMSCSETVDLKLNLSSKEAAATAQKDGTTTHNSPADPEKPPAKAQVVGWPPVRSFRKNMLSVQKKGSTEESGDDQKGISSGNGSNIAVALVKVSMDGAPYLRKVDLKMYKSYPQLSDALAKMFSSFAIGHCGSQGMLDFMNESKLMDLLNGSDYIPTYEDKDGDWMLVGDVPWEMFVESCKRLRIMKGKEAVGLAPRAMEKCKNRS